MEREIPQGSCGSAAQQRLELMGLACIALVLSAVKRFDNALDDSIDRSNLEERASKLNVAGGGRFRVTLRVMINCLSATS